MARLPLLSADQTSGLTQMVLDKLPPLKLFRTMAHAPMLTLKFAELGGQILMGSKLDAGLRELAILRVAHLVPCQYELVQHERIARDVGLTDEQIAAAKPGRPQDALSPVAQAVLAFTDEMMESVKPSAATFSRASDYFDPEQLVELTTTIAYYKAAALVMEALDIDMEDPGFDQGVKVNKASATTSAEQSTSDNSALPLGVIPPPSTEASHIGKESLPFIDLGDGSALQLLQVDLNQGLWITRVRFKPGTRISRHYHTGNVFAVTLQGQWFYSEYPNSINSPGSYLFEPAGSVHTLTVPEDQEGDTEVWFAVYGANINLTENGDIESVIDAATVLSVYQEYCAGAGLNCDGVLVHGR